MDDRSVYRLERLRLAYYKQLCFICGLIIITILGLVLYIINIYNFNISLLLMSVVLAITGIIGILTIDEKLKVLSMKIRELEND